METAIVIGITAVAAAYIAYSFYRKLTAGAGKTGACGCAGCGRQASCGSTLSDGRKPPEK